ncbi:MULTISPECIES: hypothetical protein [Streptomyces]|uniref:Uncharacterized protein n=1 Tax=Streptomyces changanensis TaxID=2964669 RepID=A0ABY5NC76_9ACTN|nr:MULTISPECIES: hypothetical protein [Streptomyces]UUS33626.1 hypothetical protein NRO40_24230 [Streptomyces changanensis]
MTTTVTMTTKPSVLVTSDALRSAETGGRRDRIEPGHGTSIARRRGERR